MAALPSPQGPDTPLPPHRQPLMGSDRINTEQYPRRRGRERDAFFWHLGLAVFCLLCNSAAAVYCMRSDHWEVNFLTGVSIVLLCLYGALGAYDSAPPEEATRRRRQLCRAVVWALGTALIFAFSYRVGATMPAAVSLATWGSGAFVSFVGLWPLVFGDPKACSAAQIESPRGAKAPSVPQRLPSTGSDCIGKDAGRRPQGREWDTLSWLYAAAGVLLLCACGVTVYSELEDPWEVTFVTGVPMDLLFVFGALGANDRTPPKDGSRRRRQPRGAVWAFATALSFAISGRAARVMPTHLYLAIWESGAVFALVGIWLLIFEGWDDPKATRSRGSATGVPRLEEKV